MGYNRRQRIAWFPVNTRESEGFRRHSVTSKLGPEPSGSRRFKSFQPDQRAVLETLRRTADKESLRMKIRSVFCFPSVCAGFRFGIPALSALGFELASDFRAPMSSVLLGFRTLGQYSNARVRGYLRVGGPATACTPFASSMIAKSALADAGGLFLKLTGRLSHWTNRELLGDSLE